MDANTKSVLEYFNEFDITWAESLFGVREREHILEKVSKRTSISQPDLNRILDRLERGGILKKKKIKSSHMSDSYSYGIPDHVRKDYETGLTCK